MNPEKYERLQSIFQRVIASDESLREAVLDRACGGDEELRRSALDLLRNAERPTELLRESVMAPSSDRVLLARAIPRKIGPHRVIREIGRGGMGVVYEAEQATVGRRVAIKVMTTGRGAASAKREIEALQSLKHPDIATIFDAGHDAELGTYLVMELIDGMTLDRYVHDRNLRRSERVSLFRRIVDAVAYAHAQGIVHLDLKPDNMLVDAEGRLKILDFGLAQMMEAGPAGAAEFQASCRAGTPGFMSPEQLDLRASRGPASDVYSLGAILYFLLSDRLPVELKGKSPQEALELVRQASPPPPGVGADLDAVILTCLARQPEKRYATAQALGDDLQRMSGRLPLQVRPPHKMYRFSRWIARNRLGIAVTSLLLVLVVAAFSVRRVSRQRSAMQAIELTTIAETACTQADVEFATYNFVEALRLYEGCYERISTTTDANDIALVLVRQKLGRALRAVGRFNEALQHLRAVHRSLVERFGPSNPKAAWCLKDIGDVYYAMREYDKATYYEQAEHILTRHGKAYGNLLARTRTTFAHYLREGGEPDRAERVARRALASAEDWVPTDPILVANARMALAALLRDNGELAEARALAEASLEDVKNTRSYTNVLRLIAGVDWLEGKYTRAEAQFRECLRIDSGNTADRLAAMNSLAVVLRSEERFEEALHYHQEAIDLARHVSPENDGIFVWLNGNMTTTRERYDAWRQGDQR